MTENDHVHICMPNYDYVGLCMTMCAYVRLQGVSTFVLLLFRLPKHLERCFFAFFNSPAFVELKNNNTYRESKKNPPHFGFRLISLVSTVLEGWYISHLKCGTHRSVWSTNMCQFCTIWASQNIRKTILGIKTLDCSKFRIFDIWYPILFCLYLSSLIL